MRVVQQSADERRLAVVHAAAREHAEEALAFVLLEILVDIAVTEVGHGRH